MAMKVIAHINRLCLNLNWFSLRELFNPPFSDIDLMI